MAQEPGYGERQILFLFLVRFDVYVFDIEIIEFDQLDLKIYDLSLVLLVTHLSIYIQISVWSVITMEVYVKGKKRYSFFRVW